MKWAPKHDFLSTPTGLKVLSQQLALSQWPTLDFTAEEQRAEAVERAGKMSLQGVQPKLSADLNKEKNQFQLVDSGGRYILKPQSVYYPELPENEALTMTLASSIGIEVPWHGLAKSKDGSFTYFIQRFDRVKHHNKLAIEDFSQLSQHDRDTKYESSMEKVAKIIFRFCSFPKIEAVKLLKRTLFNFLIGNEDMHLKNFSLVTRDRKIMLSPAYDFVNTTIALESVKEELALPLKGKKNNLTKADFLNYFAMEQLKLNKETIDKMLEEIKNSLPQWQVLIDRSFLSEAMKKKYMEVLASRCDRLGLDL